MFLILVGQVGFEPTQANADGFTDRSNSPALALSRISYTKDTLKGSYFSHKLIEVVEVISDLGIE